MSGGGSFNKGESSADSNSKFNQNVWGPQGDALKQLYSNAGSLFSNLGNQMVNQIPGSADYANQIAQGSMPAWQNQLQGGAYSGLGIGNQLMSSLNNSMNRPTATQEINNMIMGGSGNNYADAMKQQYMQDATAAQNNMLANLDARAAASGMSGGSRHGTAIAKGMQDINKNLQRNLAETGYNTFDKDLERKLAIAGQADQATLDRQQMLSNMLGQQQSTMNSGLGMGSNMQNLGLGQFASYMMPWQMMGAYSNTIGAPTVLGSGNSNSSSDAKGFGTSSYGGIGKG